MYHPNLPPADRDRPSKRHAPQQPRQPVPPSPYYLPPLQARASPAQHAQAPTARTANISVLADVALASIDPARTGRPTLPPVSAIAPPWPTPPPTGYQRDVSSPIMDDPIGRRPQLTSQTKHAGRPEVYRADGRHTREAPLNTPLMRRAPHQVPQNWHADAHRRLIRPLPLAPAPVLLRAEHPRAARGHPSNYAVPVPRPAPAPSLSPPQLGWPFVAAPPPAGRRVHPPPQPTTQPLRLLQPPLPTRRKRSSRPALEPAQRTTPSLIEQPAAKLWTFINTSIDDEARRRADTAARRSRTPSSQTTPETVAAQLVRLAGSPVSPVKGEGDRPGSARASDELLLHALDRPTGFMTPISIASVAARSDGSFRRSRSARSTNSMRSATSRQSNEHGDESDCGDHSEDGDDEDEDEHDIVCSQSLPSPTKAQMEDVKPDIRSLPTSPSGLVSLMDADDLDYHDGGGHRPSKRLRLRAPPGRSSTAAPGKKRKSYPRRDLERRKEQNAQAQKKFRTKKKAIAEKMRDDLEVQASMIQALKDQLGQKERALGEKDTLIETLKTKLHVDDESDGARP